MEETIELKYLWEIFKEHYKAIIASALVLGFVAFALGSWILPKKYSTTSTVYIENNSAKDDQRNYSDYQTDLKLAEASQILFSTNTVFEKIADESGLPYSKTELSKYITVSQINQTGFLKIKVESPSPEHSLAIAQKHLEVSLAEFERVIETAKIKRVVDPSISVSPSFPRVNTLTLLGLVLGFALAYITFLIIDIVDNKVKLEDDLFLRYEIPVLAEVMDFETKLKGGYSYEYSQKKGN